MFILDLGSGRVRFGGCGLWLQRVATSRLPHTLKPDRGFLADRVPQGGGERATLTVGRIPSTSSLCAVVTR